MGKILRFSLKLNFTPDTLGYYGFISSLVFWVDFWACKTLGPIVFRQPRTEANEKKINVRKGCVDRNEPGCPG